MPKPRKQRQQSLQGSPLIGFMYGPLGGGIIARSSSGPGSWIRKRKPHVTNTGTPVVERCSCRSFKAADSYWTAHAAALKPVWDAAVKMQPLSGYKLWMKEALTSLATWGMLPDAPSVSGGYSIASVQPGTIPADDSWYLEHCMPPFRCEDGEIKEWHGPWFRTYAEAAAACPPLPCNYADEILYPDAPELPPPWYSINPTYPLPPVVSNAIQAQGAGGTGHSAIIGLTPCTPDQILSASIDLTEFGLWEAANFCVRATAASDGYPISDGYVASFYWDADAPYLILYSAAAGSWLPLSAQIPTTAALHTVELSALGTLITVTLDGDPVISVIDSGVRDGLAMLDLQHYDPAKYARITKINLDTEAP